MENNYVYDIISSVLSLGSLDVNEFNSLLDKFSYNYHAEIYDGVLDRFEEYLYDSHSRSGGAFDFCGEFYYQVKSLAIRDLENDYGWDDAGNFFDDEGFDVYYNYLDSSFDYRAGFKDKLKEKLKEIEYEDGWNEYVDFIVNNIE